MWVCRFPPAKPVRWGAHCHRQHQIAWVAEGMGTAVIATERWAVTPTRAVWIPGGLDARHRQLRHDAVLLLPLRLAASTARSTGRSRVELAVTPLARELLLGLGEPGMETPVSRGLRHRAVRPVPPPLATTPTLPMPADDRAGDLADALLERPAEPATPSSSGPAALAT